MNKKKAFVWILIAILIALIAYAVAQDALTTAEVNNVFEMVVNNTNLAPTVAGHPVGTGERVSGNLYWTNTSPIQILVFAHAMNVAETAEIHLLINNTIVADTSGRPIGGAESSNKTIIAIIPKNSNYSVQFINTHHYEWREYPILAGKNGTLSINQTIVSTGINQTQLNTKVNKSGDTMTGTLNIIKAVLGISNWHSFGGRMSLSSPVADSTFLDIYSGNLNNNTFEAGWAVFGRGTTNNITDFEAGLYKYDRTNLEYALDTEFAGTGTLRQMNLYTQGHRNQLVIRTDGNISIGALNTSGTHAVCTYNNNIIVSSTNASSNYTTC